MFKKIATILENLFGHGNKKNESILTPTERSQFALFYRQLAQRMSSHIKYEIDILVTVDPADELLIPFDIATYIAEIHQFFLEHRLYMHATETEFHSLSLEILVPETTIRDVLPAERRKRIFAGMLKNISAQSDISLSSLVKFYHGFISSLNAPVNGVAKTDVLRFYLESVQYLVDRDAALAMREKEARQRNWALLDGIFSAFRIRTREQLNHLFDRSKTLNYLAFVLMLTIAASSLAVWLVSGARGLLSRQETFIVQIVQLLAAAAAYLIAITGAILRFFLTRLKRRRLVRCFNAVMAAAGFSSTEVTFYLKERFGFDYRRFY